MKIIKKALWWASSIVLCVCALISWLMLKVVDWADPYDDEKIWDIKKESEVS